MSRVSSVTPSSSVEEMRDGQSFPVTFFTGEGRNGTRQYKLANRSGVPVSLSGMTVKMVVKTGYGELDTELDANFPLTASIDNADQGLFSVDFSSVNFTDTQTRVVVIFYDDSGMNPVVLAQSTTLIQKAGV